MTQRRPLVEALLKFQQQQPVSFHVPGHKNGLLSTLPDAIRPALAYDVTELEGLDDLHHPEEAIREAQELLAEAYGTEESFFLVNGSTAGNLAMIYAVCEPGDRIIVQRNCHKSIFHALELAAAVPVFLTPTWDEETMTAAGLEALQVEQALQQYPDAKAVVLTSPNYYGVVQAELEAIIALSHQYEVPVLVDEAHGAHLRIGGPFPASALVHGADVVVHSAHKTLPAMTMGSFLHVQGEMVKPEQLTKYLRMLQSSSPSYLLMASLDDARAYLHTYTQADHRSFEEKRRLFLEGLSAIPKLTVVESDDPLKLMLRVERWSGFQLKEQLEAEGIYPELADAYQVLLVLPLLKSGQSFPFAEIRSRIKDAVKALASEPRTEWPEAPFQKETMSEPEYTFREVSSTGSDWVPWTKAAGRVSAGAVIPYPPGIPLIVPGEVWSTEKLALLMDNLAFGASIQGEHRLKEKLLKVMKR